MSKHGISEVDNIVKSFSDCAEKVKECALIIQHFVSEGRVPDKELVACFNANIAQLEKYYSDIIEMAGDFLAKENLPETESIYEYASKLAEFERIQKENQVIKAVEFIKRFMSVKSNIEYYACALQPYQEQASQLMNKIDSGCKDAYVNSKVYEGLKYFLRAINAPDFESEDGLQLLDIIGHYFSRIVERGLSRAQYYLAENPLNIDEHRCISTMNTQYVDKFRTSIYASMNTSDCHTSEQTQNKLHLLNHDSTESPKSKSAIAETTSPLALLEVDEEWLTIQNKVKKSAPSAKAFKEEIVRYPKETRTILPLLTNLGALSSDQIFKFGIAMDCFENDDVAKQSIDEALSYSAEKGLLSCFSLEGDKIYCLSSYTNGCLKKEKIKTSMRKFFDISFGENVIVSGDRILKSKIENIIMYNNLLLEYFLGIKNGISKEHYTVVKSSLKFIDGNYSIAVFYDGQQVECTIYNPFIECTEYENLLVVSEYYVQSIISHCKCLYTYSDNTVRLIYGKQDNSKQLEKPHADFSQTVEKVTYSIDTVTTVAKTDTTSMQCLEEISIDCDTDSESKGIICNNLNESSADTYDSDISLISLINTQEPLSDDIAIKIVDYLIDGKLATNGIYSDVMRAAMFSYAASINEKNEKTKKLSRQLLLATRLPYSDYTYTSATLSEAFSGCESECLILSGYLQALLIPGMAYDYDLNQQAETYLRNYDSHFPSLGAVKPVLNKLISIRDVIPTGFSRSILSLIGNAFESNIFVEDLQRQAYTLLSVPSVKPRIKTLPKFYNDCFGKNSFLYSCIEVIYKNEISDYDTVKEVLSSYCHVQNNEYEIDQMKIEDELDKTWRSNNSFELEYDARSQTLRHFYNRLNLIKSWVDHVSKSSDSSLDLKHINTLKKEIIQLTEQTASKLQSSNIKYINVLLWTLESIRYYLDSPQRSLSIFEEFIITGVFSTNESGIPIVDDTMDKIKYYEPWRNLIRHFVSPIKGLEDAKREILNNESTIFDNLHQLVAIEQKISGNENDNGITDLQLKEAKCWAEDRKTKFKENLELAYTYGRISEPEKELLLTIMEQYEPKFFSQKDFGCWGQFLSALEQEIDELAKKKKDALERELNTRKLSLEADESSSILNEAETLLNRDMNYSVTEDYLNRFDNGEKEFSDDLSAILHDKDSFSDFLADSVFRPLQRECERCSGKTVKSFAWSYLESKISREWTSRQKEDSRRLVENWPIRKGATQTSSISTLFRAFGFSVNNVTKDYNSREELFKIYVSPVAKSMADYRHPISIFGTQMKSPMNVVVLYGNYAPKQLVDTICSLDLGGMTIVLIDRPIDRASRRQIGEIFHTQTSGQNPFILIDQILVLYLAMYQVTERIPVLLKCTLPYTTYQPFVRDSGSTTDEMFCGRTRELATIIDPNGACVVYGGRQLGKTALLQRAESRCNKGETKDYAVYSNVIGCVTPEDLVRKLTDDICRKTNLKIQPTKSIDDFSKQIDRLFREEKVNSVLLLIDEVDNFLEGISDVNYKPLQPLIDLKRETINRFKFVLAGLHNVCRAQNATENNGVFGQLGTPLCVKPLSPTDALQLLSRPLKYLGFQIDRHPHLETILTNTNYYPGILQFFGYMIVQEFTSQYGKYYRASDGHPPFTLKDDQLGAVMNSADLNRSIKDKFRWSLELDQRYFMLARCITILYYLRDENAENWLGFSIEEIIKMATDYKLHCLEYASRNDYINLLDEMVEMGILSKPSIGLYRLRRNSFVNIIGSNFDVLDAEITRLNEEAN